MKGEHESCDREVAYYVARLSHTEELLDNVRAIAGRGFTFVCAWRTAVSGMVFGDMEPVEFQCPSCFAKQPEHGPCVNPECVPGEVARALAKETRASRFALREGTVGKEPESESRAMPGEGASPRRGETP